MESTAEVVIIGAGVNGCSLAYNLAKRGLTNIVVLEKGNIASGATGSCAGGIHQQWETEDICLLARESVKIFSQLSEELNYPINFQPNGYLTLAFTSEELESFKEKVILHQKIEIYSKLVSPSYVNSLVPLISTKNLRGAIYTPEDGAADPVKVTIAYAKACQQKGVKFRFFTKATDFKKDKNKITAVVTDKDTISTSWVVNAAGAYSIELAEKAGFRLPIEPQLYESVITERIPPTFRGMTFCPYYNLYVRQTAEGQVIMGPGVPARAASLTVKNTWSSLQQIAKKVDYVSPALSKLNVLRQQAGLYSITPDASPFLGAVPGIDNFIQMNGFSNYGFMLAPIIGQLLAELITARMTSLPIGQFSLNRFRSLIKL